MKQKPPVSKLRATYIAKLVGRCIILLLALLIWRFAPNHLEVLEGMNFFRTFSPLHLLWAIWLVDMLYQIFPLKGHLPLGSVKHFRQHFKPLREKMNRAALTEYIRTTTKAAYKVMLVWIALIAVIAGLYFTGIIDRNVMFLLSVVFYVCDLICVLIWCPFRLMMKNRCCTTCRIFNWDHLMMFSPIIFIGGFYAISLVVMAVLCWLVWEAAILIHPERFWPGANSALQCANCTDKLCTQYCQKLR